MGLDMYLRAKRYVSGYSFHSDEERNEFERLVEMFGVREFIDEDTPSAYVEFVVGYWRKANQIHAWFVENVQGGRDECQSSYVERDKLSELRDLCVRVLETSELTDGTVFTGTVYDAEHPKGAAVMEEGQIILDPRTAHELLPTQDGFFFGGTDYDQWYVEDLKLTVAQIDRALSMPAGWEFEYQASW